MHPKIKQRLDNAITGLKSQFNEPGHEVWAQKCLNALSEIDKGEPTNEVLRKLYIAIPEMQSWGANDHIATVALILTCKDNIVSEFGDINIIGLHNEIAHTIVEAFNDLLGLNSTSHIILK
ncbi:MAG UNVERIFIED_CONTAM: hypothetical protein LVQ98_08740 [Rickettsiaceae bacterium]|jgi:hypothetical protein